MEKVAIFDAGIRAEFYGYVVFKDAAAPKFKAIFHNGSLAQF